MTEVATEKKPAEQAPAITEASVVEKAKKGESLSPEENEVLKGIPHGATPSPASTENKEAGTAGAEPKPAEEKKPTDASAGETTKEVPEDRRKLILAEVDKPDAQVDLSQFKSPVELGLYWDLKKARRKNKELTDELEIQRVTRIVDDLKKKEKEAAPAVEAETDPFEGMDDDDVLSVKEAREAAKKIKTKAKTEEKPVVTPLRTVEQIRVEKVEAESKLRSKGIVDFYEVTEFAEAVLKSDADALAILQDTAKAGGNTAEKTYWLIKGSPAWPQIEKIINEDRVKKGLPPLSGKAPDPANLKKEEKLNENEKKVVTTGPGTGAAVNTKEYTQAEIANMSHADIRKLPKATRMKILETYGSTPNFG